MRNNPRDNEPMPRGEVKEYVDREVTNTRHRLEDLLKTEYLRAPHVESLMKSIVQSAIANEAVRNAKATDRERLVGLIVGFIEKFALPLVAGAVGGALGSDMVSDLLDSIPWPF